MRKLLPIILNFVLALVVFIIGIGMFFSESEGGRLLTSGFRSLKYFTNLSNLFAGFSSFVFAVYLLRHISDTEAGVPGSLQVLKLVSTTSVALTFFTVIAFLGPVFGFGGLFDGKNFFFHLIIPVAEILVFAFVDPIGKIPLQATFFVILPPLAYGIAYLLNTVINGIGEGPDTNDWYGFLTWGLVPGIGIFALICVLTWGFALLLRLAHR